MTNKQDGFNVALMCNFTQQPSQIAGFALHKNSEIYKKKKPCGNCGLSDPRPLLGPNGIQLLAGPFAKHKITNLIFV